MAEIKDAIAQAIYPKCTGDAAKNEQVELEEKITKLENMIRKAKIIDDSELAGDQTVGLTVKVYRFVYKKKKRCLP